MVGGARFESSVDNASFSAPFSTAAAAPFLQGLVVIGADMGARITSLFVSDNFTFDFSRRYHGC